MNFNSLAMAKIDLIDGPKGDQPTVTVDDNDADTARGLMSSSGGSPGQLKHDLKKPKQQIKNGKKKRILESDEEMIVIEGEVRVDFMKLAVQGSESVGGSRRPLEMPLFIDMDHIQQIEEQAVEFE